MTEPAGMTGLLVGFGSIGRRHITNLHALGVTDWAVVHTGTGTLPFEPPTPVRSYASLDDALARETPTFAVVANPTALHVATALRCTEAGAHLFLEKPVSHTFDQLDALTDAVDRHGTRVLVGFQFRYHPALHRIRELVDSGALGAPLHARVVWGEHLPDWHPWEDYRTGYAARPELGGGVHHTICHPLDYLRLCFGPPSAVRAALSDAHPLGLDVAEAADAELRTAGGPDVSLHLDYWARPPLHRVEVMGVDGTARWDYLAGDLRWWSAASDEWRVEPFPGVEARNELFVEQARHFLAVVAGDAASRCTLADGVAALRLAHAIEASSASGGGWIDPATLRPITP